ncbi:MAG: hypothetical protein IJZ30_04715 [Alphaproteobacteria bacterium]|nr:hypothetical protein [Alphaproteobacteria bacterium]
MNKLFKYLKIYLPIIICAVIFTPNVAVAWSCGWCADLVDWVKGNVLEALGIDTNVNCAVPQMEKSFCLFCPMFKIIFNAGSLMAHKSYTTFGEDLAQLLLIFLGVSLALIILRYVASFGAKDPYGLMNDVMRKVFLGITIYIILSYNYYYILNLTLVPIFDAAMNFVDLANNGNTPTGCSEAGGILGFSSNASGGGMPADVGKMIVCAVDNIENKINLLFEFGEWAFCRGTGPDRILFILPHPIYIIDAILLYLGGIFFIVAYPWVMADAVLQLGIAMTLLPFAICGYAFQGTKSYIGKIWKWILNSLFVFIFMAILLSCILGYIENLLLGALGNADADKIFVSPNEGVAFWGANMIMIIFMLCIGWNYMPIVSSLAKRFSEGSGLGAGANIGKAVSDKVEDNVSRMAKNAGSQAVNAADYVVSGVSRGAGHIGRPAMKWAVNRAGGKLNLGGMTYSNVNIGGGKKVLSRSWTNPINDRLHETYYNRFLDIKQEKDDSGILIKSEVKFKNNFIKKHLLDKKGDINVEAINKLLNSDIAQVPGAKEAIMSQVAIEVAKIKGLDIGTNFNSRNIIFDPTNPYEIKVMQQDTSKKDTNFSLKMDPNTGRVAITMDRIRSDGSRIAVFDNGMVKITTIVDKDGNEVSTTEYYKRISDNHTKITDSIEENQVVDNTGKIAKDLDPSQGGKVADDLCFGMDDSMNLGMKIPNGKTVKDMYIGLMQRNRVTKRNRQNTKFF